MSTSVAWPPDRDYLAPSLTIHGREFVWGSRTFLMGVINVTPDSFSGDGLGSDPAAAARQAVAFEAAGADILDIGGQSSRPGAPVLEPAEEARRVIPCIEAVRAASPLPISVDTFHAAVANQAFQSGADMVNDIWGLRFDPGMADAVARHGVPLVAMHNQRGREFSDVVSDVADGFHATLALCHRHGIAPDQVILDPGFGFGWTPEQNLEILRRLPELWEFRLPLLVGTSRKSTIGLVLDAPVEDRVEGTAATVALAIAAGADIVRVHDVAAMARVAKVADAVIRANWHSGAAP
jgi:dihydropteroate synthase